MTIENRWLLPQGIEEVLPAQAERIDRLCRELVDCMHSWGYELVMPPLIDYIESLLTGTGNDLSLKTFKLTDQMSGRTMGVRADMTPQVARIDAHSLKRETPSRLCYVGQVLHTRADGFSGNRSPLQVGAELYGYAGLQSDVEVLQLMIEALTITGNSDLYVDLGHVGVYRALVDEAKIDAAQQAQLFDVMQRKAVPELKSLLDSWQLDDVVRTMLTQLVDLNGDKSTLTRAREELAAAPSNVLDAIDNLVEVAAIIESSLPGVKLNFDFAELRGYHYHTGLVFCAYLAGHGTAVAWGGRYDDIGKDFGRARPATGFSIDLNALIQLQPQTAPGLSAIGVPFAPEDNVLQAKIRELRQQGERVIQILPNQTGSMKDMGCTRQLVKQDDDWQLVSIN